MIKISGIEIETNEKGKARYLKINLQKHGNNPLLEEFLDTLLIESRKGEKTLSFEDVLKRQNKKRLLKQCTV